jgi:penicillin-binding protein 1A
VEVWTRFMKAAHQGLPVASLPNAQVGWGLSNLMQASSQVSAPTPAPGPMARPAPTRTSAPPNPSARPEAAAGLDGWLMDRLFRGR